MISSELSRIVLGSIKHGGQDECRERSNRLGFRWKYCRILPEFPEDLAAAPSEQTNAVEPGRKRKRRKILRGQIREFAKSPASLELLKRNLLKGHVLKEVSAELGINYSAARSTVSRCCKQALQLPTRTRKKDS